MRLLSVFRKTMASQLKFIDAHNHLCANDFVEDLDAVIEKAKKCGVRYALVVGEHAGEFNRILELSKKYANFCVPCFGVHPVQVDPSGEERSVTHQDLEAAISWIDEHHEKLVAIGEVGLDFTPRFCKTDEHKDTQRSVLRKQVEVAKKYNLPLNVHSRSAGRPTIKLLKEAGAEKVLLHAFDGRPSVAMDGVQAGFYFSIPPCIVRSEQKQKLIKQLPLDHILLETDSPALGPDKQVRNEPANITFSCEYIAKVKGVTPETVADIAWENTIRLFPKIKNYMES